ncbi:MAG: hypothetical protein IV086_13170 [Hyphomonadaceae bacterium]|nr:hypothetical protein [Hyphomonadaceae bacterium]
MFKLHLQNFARRTPGGDAPAGAAAGVERRAEAREPVFREAVLTLEGYYRIRAVITDESSRGACVAFSTRIDLPSRIVVAEPMRKQQRWARVVWQRDGTAGLEFLRDD